MRKNSFMVVVFGASLLWAGCNTFPQAARAEPAPRTATSPASSSSASNSPNRHQVEVANLRADVQALDRRVREMNITIEELTRRNRELMAELEKQRQQNSQRGDLVDRGQLNRALSDLERKTRSANSEQRREILREVTSQIEELGKQTQEAIDALARSVSSRPTMNAPPSPSFSEDFPKEGITYTVQSGDTLSRIAARHNSTVRDIQNANQITNPAAIQIGQTLFIPQKDD